MDDEQTEFSTLEPVADNSSRQKVLVIEDTPQFADAARNLPGCEVTVAANLKQALGFMEGGKFDFVLSDVNFPAVEGGKEMDQARAVIDACLWHNLPVVFVTRADHHGSINLRRGDDNYISILPLTAAHLSHLIMSIDFREKYEKRDPEPLLNERLFGALLSEAKSKMHEEIGCQSLLVGRQPVKTSEIWGKALVMLRNLAATEEIVSIFNAPAARKDGKNLGISNGFVFPIKEKPKTMKL